jgi:hypothetical protein
MRKMAKLFKNGRSQAVRLPLSPAISPSVPSVPASDSPTGLNLVRQLFLYLRFGGASFCSFDA